MSNLNNKDESMHTVEYVLKLLKDVANNDNEVSTLLELLTSSKKNVVESAKRLYNKGLSEDNIQWNKSTNDIVVMLDTPAEYRILDCMLRCSSMHNLLQCSQKEICDVLNLNESTVKRSLKNLQTKGMIVIAVPGNSKRESTVYMVNPKLRTEGNSNRKELQSLFDDLRIKQSTDESDFLIDLIISDSSIKKVPTIREVANGKHSYDFNDPKTLRINQISKDIIEESEQQNKTKNKRNK